MASDPYSLGTDEERKTSINTVKKLRGALRLPLTVGGGISCLEDAQTLLQSGADKVSINRSQPSISCAQISERSNECILLSLSAAVKNPELISALAKHFGSQCVVCAIDASLKQNRKKEWEVVIKSGTERTGKDVIEWAKEAVERGAGEILLTSFDRL